jgi:hypothetical protein
MKTYEVTILKTTDLVQMQKLIVYHLDRDYKINGDLVVSPRSIMQMHQDFYLLMIKTSKK